MTATDDGAGPGADHGGRRVRFVPVVGLSKEEVFAACQALADADRCLLRAGHHREADALGDLFERFEAGLTGPDPAASPTAARGTPTRARTPTTAS